MIARPIVQSLLETLESFEQLKIQSVPQLHQGIVLSRQRVANALEQKDKNYKKLLKLNSNFVLSKRRL